MQEVFYMEFVNKRITVFGDSIGKGITTDGGRIEVLPVYAVNLFENAYGVKIENLSSFGNSLKRFCERGKVDKYIASIDKSVKNVVVLELGGNDADFDWQDVAADPCREHGPKTDVEEFSVLYAETLGKLLDAGVEVIPCTLPPVCSDRYFNNVIKNLADGNRVLEFFKGDTGTIYRHQEMFNNEVIKNSFRNGLRVIDLRQRFLNRNDFDSLMCKDGIHPNELGQREIFYAAQKYLAG